MRSTDDRTTRAIIRDEALRLFAVHGPDAVTVRHIAASAGVSAGLVLHHFGSKEGLRRVVDQHVIDMFDVMLAEMGGPMGSDLYDPGQATSLAEAVMRHLPPDSPAPAYLRRLLLSDSELSRDLFRRLFEMSRVTLEALDASGIASAGPDPVMRAAFLMANDLAVLLLREQLTAALGVDPLSEEGLTRWAREVLTVYATGFITPPEGDQA